METILTTSDFYLASYLFASDVQLIGHIRMDNRSTFEFKGSNLDDLINGYYYDSAKVSPMTFAKAIRNLKTLMYSNTTFNNKPIHNDATQTQPESTE